MIGDWFGGLSYAPYPDMGLVVVLLRTWPLDRLDGDWWQVWRERLADLVGRYPGYRVSLFCVRRQEFVGGMVQ